MAVSRSVGLFLLGWGVCAWLVMGLAPISGNLHAVFFAAVFFIALEEWCAQGARLDAAVESVLPPIAVVASENEASEELLDGIAREARMTDREAEIFCLLAHGRNAKYLQDSLGIKRSTAKTHISRIYAKLGVHSQQELIDLVENRNTR